MANKVSIDIDVNGAGRAAAALNQINSNMASMGAFARRAALAVGTAVAAIAGIRSVAGGASDIIHLGGRMSDLAARTDVSIRRLLVFEQALQDAGAGAGSFERVLAVMQRQLSDAAEQGGEAARGLDKLGLAAEEMLRLAPAEQFELLRNRIAAIEDPAQRTAVAMQIFGRSGAELLPFFRDAGVLDQAQRRLGRLPEVLERNAALLDGIGDTLGGLPIKARQLFAGIADQLALPISGAVDKLNDIDLTPLGQRIGAFVGVAIEEWNAGRFDKFVGLSIEAGFIEGFNGARQAFASFTEFAKKQVKIISDNIRTHIADSLATLLPTGAAQAAAQEVAGINPWQASIDKAEEFIKRLKLAAQEGKMTAQEAAAAEARLYYSIRPQERRHTEGSDAFVNRVAQQRLAVLKQTADLLNRSGDLQAAINQEELWGVEHKNAALQKLNALADAYQTNLRIAAHVREEEETINRLIAAQTAKRGVSTDDPLTSEAGLQRGISVIRGVRSNIEGSFDLTDVEKYRHRIQLLKQERDLMQARLDLLREEQRLNPNDQQIGARIDTAEGELRGTDSAIATIGPDPASWGEQFRATFSDLQTQWGTWSQQMAGTFSGVFNGAISSISNGISGLILGTQTWGQALMNIGTSIATTIVQAFVQMGVRYIATRILMWTVGRSLDAAGLAANLATAKAYAAVWASAATLSTIGSYGASALAAPGLIAAAQGIVAGTALLGFAEGGFTGGGRNTDVAGVVHANEYVMPASAVQRHGIGFFDALKDGDGAAMQGGAPTQYVFYPESRYEELLRSGQLDDGIVHRINANRHRIGIRS